jgi:hypothetical protein
VREALYVDHDNALALGAVRLFDKATQVIWITGDQNDRTGHTHGRHGHDRVDRATLAGQTGRSEQLTGSAGKFRSHGKCGHARKNLVHRRITGTTS